MVGYYHERCGIGGVYRIDRRRTDVYVFNADACRQVIFVELILPNPALQRIDIAGTKEVLVALVCLDAELYVEHVVRLVRGKCGFEGELLEVRVETIIWLRGFAS